MPASDGSESLDTLPAELLLDIIEYFGEQEHLPKRDRAAFVLSLVNRRLRALTLPILAREISVCRSEELVDIAHYFLGRGKERAACVRSVHLISWSLTATDD